MHHLMLPSMDSNPSFPSKTNSFLPYTLEAAIFNTKPFNSTNYNPSFLLCHPRNNLINLKTLSLIFSWFGFQMCNNEITKEFKMRTCSEVQNSILLRGELKAENECYKTRKWSMHSERYCRTFLDPCICQFSSEHSDINITYFPPFLLFLLFTHFPLILVSIKLFDSERPRAPHFSLSF